MTALKRVAIFISGRGSNMESLLIKSRRENLPVEFIAVSDNPSAEGIKTALSMGVRTEVIDNCPEGWRLCKDNVYQIEKIIAENNIALVLLAGFMRIIPSELIERHPLTFVNIHPSLLPSFKGKQAQKDAYEYGAKVSGCTVHFIDSGVDTGPIILQRAVDISGAESVDEVKSLILREEHQAYFDAFKLLLNKKISLNGRRVDFGD